MNRPAKRRHPSLHLLLLFTALTSVAAEQPEVEARHQQLQPSLTVEEQQLLNQQLRDYRLLANCPGNFSGQSDNERNAGGRTDVADPQPIHLSPHQRQGEGSHQGNGGVNAGEDTICPAHPGTHAGHEEADEKSLPHGTEEIMQKSVAQVTGMLAEKLESGHG